MRPSTRRHAAAAFVVALLLTTVPLAPTVSATGTPVGNPDLAASCGTDVTLVLDRSGSIGGNNVLVRQAAQSFVDALIGTGSKVQVISFSDRATAEPGGSSALSDLAFTDPSALTIPLFPSGGYTNWDDALEMARRSPAGHAPLVVMITDGDPTRRNATQPDGHGGTLGPAGSGSVDADLDAAISEANALKTLAGSPAHLFAVGVGSAVSNASSEARLVAISGPDELTFSGGNPNIPFGTADYTLVSEFTALKTTVSRFVRELCGPSLNVVKMLQPANGGPAVQASAADPFSFTASLNPAASSWSKPAQAPGASASLTTIGGVANFVWEPATPDAITTIDLAEQPETGWVYNGRRCWVNNLDGTPAQLVVDDVGLNVVGAAKDADAPTLPALGPYQAMNCEVYNRELRPASVSVDKITVPGGRPEAFSFELHQGATTVGTIPALTDAGAAAAFPAVAPGTYDVVESASAHFTQTGATCDDLGTPAAEQVGPTGLVIAEASQWQCTFTNTIHNGTITIVKDLVDAPAASFEFSSDIPGHSSFTLDPTGDVDASTSFSVAPGTYAVAESGPAPYALSATCSQGSTPGAVVVTPDATTTCTFTNTAPNPTVVVTKDAGVPTLAEPGGDVTYAVTVTNTSVEPLTITELSDVVQGNTIDVLALAPERTTCAPLQGSTLPAGATVACSFVAPATGNAGATVTDTVTVRAEDSDGHDATASAEASVDIVDVAPTLLVSKSTATPTIAEPGADVVYDVTVTNTSDEAVLLTTLTDQIGAGALQTLATTSAVITQTSCTLGPIAVGASMTCSFTTPVNGNAGDQIADTVRAVAIDDDGSSVEASDDAMVTLTDVLPAIDVTKTAAPSTVAEPGGPVTYSVGITNLQAEPVVLDAITDAVGGGVPFAAPGTCAALVGTTLAGSASTSCTFTLPLVADAADGPVTDTVAVTASDDEGHEVTDTASATVAVTDVAPEISVTKTASPVSVSEPGAMVTFTVGIESDSIEPVTIDAIVDVVDGAPALDVATLTGTCDDLIGTSLDVGGSTSCTFDLFVAGDAGDHIDDVITVSAGDDDGNQATGTAEASVAVTDVAPTIELTKTADRLSVAEPGADVSYTLSVHNTSPEAVTLTTLSDSVAGGPGFDVTAVPASTCALPQTLPLNGTYSCAFTVPVTGNADDSVSDTVTATATDNDGGSATAEASATVRVTDVQPTISVIKTASAASVPEPGAAVTYTVAVHNGSAEPVTLTELTDVVGSNPGFDITEVAGTTCVVPASIAVGATSTCTFTVPVSGNAGDEVTDTVTAVASDDEQNETSASDDASVAITDVAPQITVTKVPAPSLVAEPGGDVTYTVSVSNASVEAVTLTDLSDVVGSGTAFDVTEVSGTTCSLPQTIALGGSYTCEFSVEVSGNAGDEVTDTVTATASDDDGGETTAQASAIVDVTDVAPTITVTKTAGGPSVAEPGADVTYTVAVQNSSFEEVTLTSLSDVVGADPAIDVTDIAGTTCVVPTSISAGATYECTFTLPVSGNAGDVVGDVVTAVVEDDDGSEASDDDAAEVEVLDVLPSITVTKDATTAAVDAPGGAADFAVTVVNSSPEPVTITSIVDVVDGDVLDVTAVAGSVTATTCATGTVLGAAGGGADTYACTFTLLLEGTDPAEVVDVLTVEADDDDGNTASASDDATTTLVPVADLGITKVATAVPVVGQTGTYTFTVINTGPSAAVDVTVTDVLPDALRAIAATGTGWDCVVTDDATTITCTTETLASGATSSITVAVAVPDGGTADPITNTVTVASPTRDPDLANNTATSTVQPIRVLGVTLTPPAATDLPKTGSEIRGWVVLADLLLIGGVLLLLAGAGGQLRPRRDG